MATSLIEIFQQRHASVFMSNIDALMTKRDNFQANKENMAKIKNIKHNIKSIKPDTQIMANSSTGSDYLDLIYAARTDTDIDSIVQFLRLSVKKYSFFRL